MRLLPKQGAQLSGLTDTDPSPGRPVIKVIASSQAPLGHHLHGAAYSLDHFPSPRHLRDPVLLNISKQVSCQRSHSADHFDIFREAVWHATGRGNPKLGASLGCRKTVFCQGCNSVGKALAQHAQSPGFHPRGHTNLV